MATIESTLKTLISPLVAGGCFNGVNASPSVTLPYAVFHEISATPENGLQGYLGLTKYSYQIDVFAGSPEHAKSITLNAIKPALVGSSLEATLTFHMKGEYSDADKTHQYISEFEIWAP